MKNMPPLNSARLLALAASLLLASCSSIPDRYWPIELALLGRITPDAVDYEAHDCVSAGCVIYPIVTIRDGQKIR